tara:strand:- start:2161 stop:2598 length:438 start_codon:yes stop_codon:yes gene_type:complete
VNIYSAVALDASGDIDYYTGFLSGLDALKARIDHRLLRFRGEWAFDTKAGLLRMPGGGVGKPPRTTVWNTWIRKDLEACPGVGRVGGLVTTFNATTGVLSATGSIYVAGQSIPIVVTLPTSVAGVGNVPAGVSFLVTSPSPTWVV